MRFLHSPAFRIVIVIAIILITFGLFAWYIVTHPEVVDTFTHIGLRAIILLTFAYTITIVANGFILHYSLEYVKRKTPILDNVLLTGYSTIVNFFGPLQSGPGFRAVYLKQKYNIEIRKFIGATILFYLFFALINSGIIGLAIGARRPGILVFILVTLIVLAFLLRKMKPLLVKIKLLNILLTSKYPLNKSFWLIGASTILLVIGSMLAFGIELNLAAPGTSWWSVVVYSASANLALFVSLTPGAIGFREAFLLLTQQLHHVDTQAIAAASIIDRAFYFMFLLALFVILLLINYRKHLDIFSIKQKSPATKV